MPNSMLPAFIIDAPRLIVCFSLLQIQRAQDEDEYPMLCMTVERPGKSYSAFNTASVGPNPQPTRIKQHSLTDELLQLRESGQPDTLHCEST